MMVDPAQDQTEGLISAINRLAAAVDRLAKPENELAHPSLSRYTRPDGETGLVTEDAMAQLLNIKPRTLGDYRRKGKLPGCWVRNGGHIRWHVRRALETWHRGIP